MSFVLAGATLCFVSHGHDSERLEASPSVGFSLLFQSGPLQIMAVATLGLDHFVWREPLHTRAGT